jgi:glycosyltransferase involved in cell wall biosynthesis
MENSPVVTVIMPAYNAELYLAEAIESVLSQSYAALELIVVNDGSTDRTEEIIQRFAPSVYSARQAHQGVAAALNCGLQLARGEYISFLDADDLWAIDKLAIQVQVLQAEPALSLVFGSMQQFDSPELAKGNSTPLHVQEISHPAYVKGTALIRRSLFDHIGWFDSRWQVGEFIDWYLRAQDAGAQSRMLDDLALYRRSHQGNMTAHMRNERLDYVRIIQARRERHLAAAQSSSDR